MILKIRCLITTLWCVYGPQKYFFLLSGAFTGLKKKSWSFIYDAFTDHKSQSFDCKLALVYLWIIQNSLIFVTFQKYMNPQEAD